MLFTKLISLSTLVAWSRALRHGLQAGLDIPRVLEMQAKNGPIELRKIASEMAIQLRGGESFQQALAPHANRFPPLFVELVAVGEESGNLPEMFAELEKYFSLRMSMMKQFRAAVALPIIQFLAAVFVVVPLLIVILHLIDAPFKVLGLKGFGGAISWYIGWIGAFALLFFAYKTIQTDFTIRAKIENLILRIPKLGACLRSFVMYRFCTALYLTMGAGLPVKKAIDMSLRGSGNANFQNSSENIQHSIKVGYDLTESLTMSRLFEDRFLHILEVAETSGRIAESMEQQARQYAEEAEHQLKVLTSFAGFAVWAIVAIFIIFMIFSLAQIYLNAINPATYGI